MRKFKYRISDIKHRLCLFGLGIGYYLSFLTCYHYVISPIYSSIGLTFLMLPAWAWGISFVLAILPLLWLPLNFTRPSDFASWFLYLCLISPSNIIIFMVSNRPLSEIVILAILLTTSFLLFEFIRQKGLFAIPHIKSSTLIFTIFLPIVMITLSIVALSKANYKIDISFSDVYVRRMEARETLESNVILGYMLAFLKSVFVPIAIVYGIQQKKLYYIGLAVFAVIAIFSLEGTKATVILPVILVIIIFLAFKNRINHAFWLLGSFILLILLSLFEAACIGTNIISAYIVQRQLAVPSLLTTYYWEYFTSNPYFMMKDSIIGSFLPYESIYSISKSYLIGYEYFGDIELNANTNIWASAFADFGYVGMIGVSILAALILKVFDSLGRKDRFVFASACCTTTGIVWVNGALHTSLLSNGIFLLIVALWLYPSKKSKSVAFQNFEKITYNK
jgi:hypothetical protein